jgi:aminoglycoside phosphotransferase (APT) family kinase protein
MSPEETFDLVLARGFVTAREIVEGGLRMEEVPARNAGVRVVAPRGRSWYVKSAPAGDDAGARALRLEAAFYTIANAPDSRLRPYVARLEWADPERAVLVLELLDGRGVYDCDDGGTELGLPPIGAHLAAALAACHESPLPASDEAASQFPREAPWILNLARPRVELLQDVSMAQVEMLRLIQRTPPVIDGLDRLRAEWAPACLIHGDVKWSNVMVIVDGSGLPVGIRLLDWETAAVSDPMWDVGAVLHAYLAHVTHLLAMDDDATADAAARRFAERLPAAQREMRSFINRYFERPSARAEADSLSDRAVRVSAARLVQSAWEWCQGEHAIPRAAAGMLQLAVNIFTRPRDARRTLLDAAQ